MIQYDLRATSAFEVAHNSATWRIATHTSAACNAWSEAPCWGVHEDSEEAFVLLAGSAWLAVCGTDSVPCVQPLMPLAVSLVCAGEQHMLVCAPGTKVLVFENRDMAHSTTCRLTAEEREAVLAKLKKKGFETN